MTGSFWINIYVYIWLLILVPKDEIEPCPSKASTSVVYSLAGLAHSPLHSANMSFHEGILMVPHPWYLHGEMPSQVESTRPVALGKRWAEMRPWLSACKLGAKELANCSYWKLASLEYYNGFLQDLGGESRPGHCIDSVCSFCFSLLGGSFNQLGLTVGLAKAASAYARAGVIYGQPLPSLPPFDFSFRNLFLCSTCHQEWASLIPFFFAVEERYFFHGRFEEQC